MRPQRHIRFVNSQMDTAKTDIARVWKSWSNAGAQDPDLVFDQLGGHTCGARAIVRGVENPVEGVFRSDDCHAEMDVLQQVEAQGYDITNIVRIEIEKEPCPRCAVVLNNLDLANKVVYKTHTLKSAYPTWTYPDIDVEWKSVMRVDEVADHVEDQDRLLNFFHSHEWWDLAK